MSIRTTSWIRGPQATAKREWGWSLSRGDIPKPQDILGALGKRAVKSLVYGL